MAIVATDAGTVPGDEVSAETETEEAEISTSEAMDKVIAVAKAREEGKTKPEDKHAAKKIDVEAKPEAKPEAKGRKAGDVAALVKREYEATQATKRAEEVLNRYKDLDEALGKKDARGALIVLAKAHGLSFADFVKVLDDAEPAPDRTPAEIAEEAAKKVVAESKAEDEKKAAAHEADAIKERLAAMHTKIEGIAQADTTRWPEASREQVVTKDDSGRPILVGEYAWLLVEEHFRTSGQKVPLEDVLDLVEKKLLAKNARGKSEPAKPGEVKRTEGASAASDGRAAEPSFTHRNTSGGPVGRDDDVPLEDLPEHEAIRRAAKRANIAL